MEVNPPVAVQAAEQSRVFLTTKHTAKRHEPIQTMLCSLEPADIERLREGS